MKRPPKQSLTPSSEFLEELHSLGYKRIVGLDEVGRGPIAGPLIVVATEVSSVIDGVTDSKKLSAQERTRLCLCLKPTLVQCQIGWASNTEIDTLGLSKAQALAYQRALTNIEADLLLTDYYDPPTNHPYISTMRAETVFYPVAAASIIAKVYRDQLMRAYSQFFPPFGWQQNAGYGTKKHIEALTKHGLTPLHRRSFLTKFQG